MIYSIYITYCYKSLLTVFVSVVYVTYILYEVGSLQEVRSTCIQGHPQMQNEQLCQLKGAL